MWLRKIAVWIAEAFREGAVGVAVHKLFTEGTEVVAKKGMEEFVKNITEHHRAELMLFIEDMSDAAARGNLLSRIREAQGNGTENKMIRLLTRVYLTVKDKPENHWIFTALGAMNDEEFERHLEMLDNDLISQFFKRAKIWFSERNEGLNSTLRRKANRAKRNARDLRDHYGFARRRK